MSALNRQRWLLSGDYVIFFLVAGLILLSYWAFWGGWSKQALAEITISGKHWRNVELYQDQIIHVPGELGESVLQVKDGRIRFISSPCTQKLCIRQGWLELGGASATCLPNKISVQVLSDDPSFDTMNF